MDEEIALRLIATRCVELAGAVDELLDATSSGTPDLTLLRGAYGRAGTLATKRSCFTRDELRGLALDATAERA